MTRHNKSTAVANPLRLALLGYSRKDFDYITRLVGLIDLNRPLELLAGNLSKTRDVKCDLVIAILDNVSNLDAYNRDIASVKQGRSRLPVICVAREVDRQVLDSYRSGVHADHIIFMPIQLERFTAVIRRLGIDTDGGVESDEASRSEAGASAQSASKLGDLLAKSGIITQADLDLAAAHQKTTGLRINDALIDLGLITEKRMLECLTEQLRTSVTAPHQYAAVDLNVVALIPEHIARRFNCIAIEKHDNELIVATTDVLDMTMLNTLRDTTDMRITAILGTKDDIATYVERRYNDIASRNDASRLVENIDEQVEYVKNKPEDGNTEETTAVGTELGIIKLINVLITNAVRDRASDIHIEPAENELIVRYRVDGDMRKVMSPPKRSHHAIVTRIKILSDMDTAEHRLPQDGRMAIKIGQREVDIRVSVLPTVLGEKVVLRILDKEAFERGAASLGLTPNDERIFRSQIAKPHGIIIVTGPTGSGKSTTLYSALQFVKNAAKNIIAVEDPVKFHIEGINQVNVNTKAGLTFETALRSIMQQDPDIVLIGEIRDSETADIAIKMALTGRLVLSTLHTNDAASSIASFTAAGIPPLLLGSSLNLIVAQRLVRKICARCKTEYKPSDELLLSLGLNPEKVQSLYKGSGCVTCNGSGFSGRTAIFEMLQVSKNIQKLILRNAPTPEIQEAAESEGMKTLRQVGLDLAIDGTTTIEQVIAATIGI